MVGLGALGMLGGILPGSMERQQMIADAISEQARHQMTNHHNTASGKPGTERIGRVTGTTISDSAKRQSSN